MDVTQAAQPERPATPATPTPTKGADMSPLRLLATPPRLSVPIYSSDPDAIPLKAIGTRVSRGGALIDAPATGATYVPISPAYGTIVAKTQAMLLNGARVAAVEISLDASEPAAPSTAATVPPSSPPPTSLADLIDRLRQCAVWTDRRTSPDLL